VPTPAGVCCRLGGFHIDPTRPVGRALITPGHSDHARAGHGAVLATQETLDLMRLRYGDNFAGATRAARLGEAVDVGGVAVPEHRQAEGRLGDEHVAALQLERRAGRVGNVLVVAGGDDPEALAVDLDLHRAEHVAGRMEAHGGTAERQALARRHGLRRAGEIVAIAQPHHVEGFLRRQHRAMAGAGVVGMAVGDHGLVHRPGRVDVKAAGLAAHARRRRHQHILRTHAAQICHIGARNRADRSSMAQPLFVSSGDLLADRRYQWAVDYLKRGDPVAAADVLEQVVEAAPDFATAWFALATIREQQGDHEGAVAAFEAARDADPEDYHGARLHLARLGVGEATPAMTAVYVRRLFDQHAPDFDESLLKRLDYRAPALLLEALRRVAGGRLRLGSVLDLGCGTGLAGAAFRPFCDWLVGVDLSPAMIEQARGKGLYDRLVADDLLAFLAAEQGAQHQLVLAADVFVYVSDLVPIARAVAGVLAPDGSFAFTVETHEGEGVRLAETLRYAHGLDHVRAALGAAGLQCLQLEPASTRTEKGAPVPGLLVVAASTASPSTPKD
ncbi:MAG TPA: tetratricopeptide repeat protein, partial [Candidatus Limnocylindrales bacterium]